MTSQDLNIFFKERIESSKESIEERLSRWDTIRPDRIPGAYYGLAIASRSIAIYSLLLGRKIEALEWFKRSAKYFRNTVEAYRSIYGPLADEEWNCIWAIYMAELSGDISLLDKGIQLSLAFSKNHPERHDDFVNNY